MGAAKEYISTRLLKTLSSISAEDLQESPTPSLNYNHVRRHLPFIKTSSIDSLPDYFTAVQNLDLYLSVDDTDSRLEDVPETQPCREHALQMTTVICSLIQIRRKVPRAICKNYITFGLT